MVGASGGVRAVGGAVVMGRGLRCGLGCGWAWAVAAGAACGN